MIYVVSGVPRSGTSLMMQMLAAGGMPILADELRAADVNNPRGYYEWEPAKRLLQEPAAIEQAEGKAVKAISSLLFSLPPKFTYRVIFMRRPLEEVVKSQATMIDKLATKGAALPPPAMVAALAAHLKLVDGWLSDKNFITTCPVEYHKLLKDPTSEARLVAEFLGLSLDVESMARQVDPALYRSRTISSA